VRMSELARREVVNLTDGRRLGTLAEGDLVLDEQTGQILELWLAGRSGWWGRAEPVRVPWSCVRRVGPQVILLELEETRP
jgi:YlmC/YmxH family sporulation protein